MGLLVNGVWKDEWYDTKSSGGEFVRQDSQFVDWILSGKASKFTPEKNRYHLYVSLACPWAHRVLIMRTLKMLEDIISLSIVDPVMLENGWAFSDRPGSIPDTLHQKKYLYEIYQIANPIYTGRVTVPVLWDKKHNTIVNNESAQIIRILNSEFNELSPCKEDFYPSDKQTTIDQINDFVYENINNGVYRCGFATSQPAYDKAYSRLFDAFDYLESQLEGGVYLVGKETTEADIRLYTTLVRFEPVYYAHFKCNKYHITEFPNLSRYLKRLYHTRGFKESTCFDHIKTHYYASHRTINPTGIVPQGPDLSWLVQ